MERNVFSVVVDRLARAPRSGDRPPKCTYTAREVVAVMLWATLHDRPISWAVRRENWPPHDRTRRLPSSATMSRRARDPAILRLLERVRTMMRVAGDGVRTLVVDGRALPVARHSADPDAAFGYGAGGLHNGYKLHMLADLCGNCRAFRVTPMNAHEPAAARELLGQLDPGDADTLLADAAYDDNRLYDAAGGRGIELNTPRRYKDADGLGHHRHSPHRLAAIERLRANPAILKPRRTIEGLFGTQGNTVGGLGPLPNCVRTLPRVTRWVAAKLVIDAAHRLLRTQRTQP